MKGRGKMFEKKISIVKVKVQPQRRIESQGRPCQ